MSRPLLLDLFCGAGGAAMGYDQAGFEVVGVDIKPQPHYPFEFIQGDALNWLERWGEWPPYAAIHASPPCQAYTQAQRLQKNEHPDLLPESRRLLDATGRPYVIENVPGAPMPNYVQICGQGIGLQVRRHRWFESNRPLMGVPCHHTWPYLTIYGHAAEWRHGTHERFRTSALAGKDAMGVPWMTRDEMAQAIPPAYTQFIGEQLLEHLARVA